jgi:hypothetical protein
LILPNQPQIRIVHDDYHYRDPVRGANRKLLNMKCEAEIAHYSDGSFSGRDGGTERGGDVISPTKSA